MPKVAMPLERLVRALEEMQVLSEGLAQPGISTGAADRG
jgi:hypothetical protein